MQPPKFFSNTADDAHCLQAAVKMALSSSIPKCELSFPELFALSGNSGQSLTWPLRITAILAASGYKIAYVDSLNLEEFIKDPAGKMTEVYGKEVADAQLRGSDIEQVVQDARLLLSSNLSSMEFRVPNFDDLIGLLERGYLCICNVNAKALTGKIGYSGHFILAYEWSHATGMLAVHNPGLPPAEAVLIDKDTFLKAWSYPTEVYRNILAIHSSENDPACATRLREVIDGYRRAFRSWLHQSHSKP